MGPFRVYAGGSRSAGVGHKRTFMVQRLAAPTHRLTGLAPVQ
ncbi:MAG: hypothetical protein V3T45_05605 [Nitrospinaceae bacterium]